MSRLNEAHDASSAPAIAPSDPFSRELYVGVYGLVDGIEGAWDSAKQHPLRSLTTMAGSACIAAGMAYVESKIPAGRVLGQAVGLAFSYSMVKDVALRFGAIKHALSDSADGLGDIQQERKAVAETISPFLVDFVLASAGGALGVGLQRVSAMDHFAKKPVFSPLSESAAANPTALGKMTNSSAEATRVYEAAQGAMLRLHIIQTNGNSYGSAFVVDKGHAITNFHVVAGSEDMYATDLAGNKYFVGVTRTDKTTDLALLNVYDPDGRLNILPLAETLPANGQPVHALGWSRTDASSSAPEIASGTLVKQVDAGSENIVRMPAPIEPDEKIFSGRIAIRRGFSGGPWLDEQGRVVGVTFAGTETDNIGLSIPNSTVRSFLNQDQTARAQRVRKYAPILNNLRTIRPRPSQELTELYNNARTGIFKLKNLSELHATAFVIDDEGHLITSGNKQGWARDLRLNNNGTWSIPVKLVHADEDLALLKLEQYAASTLKPRPMPIGIVNGVDKDQPLLALGFPRAWSELAASAGKLGTPRQSRTFLKLESEEGFNGAPVVDSTGNVVGMMHHLSGNNFSGEAMLSGEIKNRLHRWGYRTTAERNAEGLARFVDDRYWDYLQSRSRTAESA